MRFNCLETDRNLLANAPDFVISDGIRILGLGDPRMGQFPALQPMNILPYFSGPTSSSWQRRMKSSRSSRNCATLCSRTK